MNEKFFELPKEKQLRIINGAMEVFSKYDYKHASTDEMAAKAGISKGLLFYYFHNKKALYLFLFQYVEDYLKAEIVNYSFLDIRDFFDLMIYSGEQKVKILTEMPYMSDFVLSAFYSQNEEISKALDERIAALTKDTMAMYFENIDFTKFKEDVSPQEVLNMLIWMGDGYMHQKRRAGAPFSLDEVEKDYCRWCQMLKQVSYKEEFLDGNYSG